MTEAPEQRSGERQAEEALPPPTGTLFVLLLYLMLLGALWGATYLILLER